MKKLTVLIALIVIVAIAVIAPEAAYANSAAPIRKEDGSGIIFKQHESVKIEKEVLNITVKSNITANIEAIYTMKNTGSDPISVDTMFLAHARTLPNREISVTRNGVPIPFSEEFYGKYSGNSVPTIPPTDDWEEIVASQAASLKPFGDGGGFYEYRIKEEGAEKLTAEFASVGTFFVDNDNVETRTATAIKMCEYFLNGNVRRDLVIVGGDNLDITAYKNYSMVEQAEVIKTKIDDIYDYLYQEGVEYAMQQGGEATRGQFTAYLLGVSQYATTNSFFRYHNYSYPYADTGIINAINYTVDFAAGESVELKVSYVYQMGTSGYRNTVDFKYYLTPAKYWNEFKDLEINVFCKENYTKLKNASLNFKKIEDGHYQYKSTTLPDKELTFSVSNGKANPVNVVLIVVIVIIVLIIAAVIGLGLLLRRLIRGKKKGELMSITDPNMTRRDR